MRDYELICIVHPEVDQEELETLVDEVKDIVESSGVVQQVEPVGRRRLAYPIQKVREGQYIHMKIGMEPEGIAELERGLKLRESIIRHLIVRADEG
ncbi:MAG: 30S ribosomal protein S6 [Anaerolineae bacterium]|jgi:small subunit ribosomal protein S6